MDKSFLKSLGLDPEKDLRSLMEDVEDKQCELLERLETTRQESRKEELMDQLSRVETVIAQIKDRLEAVNSAIVLDMDDIQPEASENAPKQVSVPTEPEKTEEADLASKVQALKDKIQAKTEEEPVPVKAEEKTQSVAAVQAEKEYSSELQHALQCYRKKEFAPAFHTFKQLAEQNDPAAQYMLACMYKRAEGTAADPGREEYWMKRAADNGDPAAQFDYAVIILSRRNADAGALASGMDYLNRSAAQGNKDAMERYIELVEKGDGGPKEVIIARDYCEKLLPLLKDSFEIQKYTQLSKNLHDQYVKNIVSRYGRIFASITSAVGALILIVVTVLLFGNYHQENLITYTALSEIPKWISSILPGIWHELPPVTSPAYRNLNILPAIAWLIAAGWMLRSIGHTFKCNAAATLVVRFAAILRYVAIGGHIYLCSRVEAAMQNGVPQGEAWLKYYFPVENLVAFAVMIIVGCVAGRVINWIVRKILGAVLKVKL